MTITTAVARARILALAEALPEGRWTTYGDIGEAVYGHRQAGQAIGNALKPLPFDHPSAHRVRMEDGTAVAANVNGRSLEDIIAIQEMWNVRSQVEGVPLLSGGRAHWLKRLSVSDLRALLSMLDMAD